MLKTTMHHMLPRQLIARRQLSSWSIWSWLGLSKQYDSTTVHAKAVPVAMGRPQRRRGAASAEAVDEYKWMEDVSPDFRDHLRIEARYCQSELQRMGVLQLAATLRKEAEQRRDHSMQLAGPRGAPPGERIGDWLYSSDANSNRPSSSSSSSSSSTNSGDGNSSSSGGSGSSNEGGACLLSRQHVPQPHGSPDSARHVVLDDARLSAAVTHAERITGATLVPAVCAIKLSACHRFVVVTVPQVVAGGTSDVAAALLLECSTGRLLPGGVLLQVGNVEWLASGTALLATRPDKAGRPWQVWLHVLPEAHADPMQRPSPPTPELLLNSNDPAVFLDVGRTKDGRYLLINANTKTSAEVHLLDAYWRGPQPPVLRCVQRRNPGLEYYVEHHANHLIILTNHQPYAAPNRSQPQPIHNTETRQLQRLKHWSGNDLKQRHDESGQASRGASIEVLYPAPRHGESDGVSWASGSADSRVDCRQPPNQGAVTAAIAAGAEMAGAAAAEAAAGGAETARAAAAEGAVVAKPRVAAAGEATAAGATAGAAREAEAAGKAAAAGIAEYRVMHVPGDADSWETDAWEGVSGLTLPHGASITDMDMFDGWCALYGRMHALPAVWVVHLESQLGAAPPAPSMGLHAQNGRAGTAMHAEVPMQAQAMRGRSPTLVATRCMRVPLPSWVTHVTPGVNAHHASHTLRLVASSPIHPPHTYDYYVDRHELHLLQVGHVAGRCMESGAWAAAAQGSGSMQPVVAQPAPTRQGTPPGSEGHVITSAQVPHNDPIQLMQTRSPDAGMAHGEAGQQHAHVLAGVGQWALHRPEDYMVVRLWVPVPAWTGGGTQSPVMPITLAGHKDCLADLITGSGGPGCPVLLLGYGAYGQVTSTAWDPGLMGLMERRVVVAWAHVRGGGDMDRAWVAAGRQAAKVNSLVDYRTAIEALVAARVAAPGMIAAYAYSAGALLVGGALVTPATRRQLSCAVLHVGLLDLLSCMSRDDLPLTAHEQDEWGDSTNATTKAGSVDATGMRAVCPYYQLGLLQQEWSGQAGMQHKQQQQQGGLQLPATATAGAAGGRNASGSDEQASGCGVTSRLGAALPPILASAAELDARVPCWAPAKWVARARKLQARQRLDDRHPVLLRVLWNRGHHADEEEAAEDSALYHAFMLMTWRAAAQRQRQRDEPGSGS